MAFLSAGQYIDIPFCVESKIVLHEFQEIIIAISVDEYFPPKKLHGHTRMAAAAFVWP